MEQSHINVLLIEDDVDLRESVVEWLEMAGMVVTTASCAAECYPVVSKTQFQVAVVDIGLPDQSGYVLAEYLRANTDMSIIMLTARGAVDDKVRGYDSGADLYLVKPVDCRELSAAIGSIASRNKKTLAKVQSSPTGWSISRAQWMLYSDRNEEVSLSSKELMFLELLASTPGRIVAREVVLATLYQRHDYYAARSLDSMVRRLRAKVATETSAEFPVRTVYAVGYCFTDAIVIAS